MLSFSLANFSFLSFKAFDAVDQDLGTRNFLKQVSKFSGTLPLLFVLLLSPIFQFPLHNFHSLLLLPHFKTRALSELTDFLLVSLFRQGRICRPRCFRLPSSASFQTFPALTRPLPLQLVLVLPLPRPQSVNLGNFCAVSALSCAIASVSCEKRSAVSTHIASSFHCFHYPEE